MDVFLHLLAQEHTNEKLFSIGLAPSLVAVAGFFICSAREVKGLSKKVKWFFLAVLPIGMILGWAPFSDFFFNSLYQEMYGGGPRKTLLYSAGLFLPILTAAGLVGFGMWHDRRGIDEL